MKINISMETTPAEFREFLGLPEVQAFQEEMIEKIREQMQAGVEGFDPLTMMRPFIAPNLQSMEAMQRAFWNGLSAMASTTGARKSRGLSRPVAGRRPGGRSRGAVVPEPAPLPHVPGPGRPTLRMHGAPIGCPGSALWRVFNQPGRDIGQQRVGQPPAGQDIEVPAAELQVRAPAWPPSAPRGESRQSVERFGRRSQGRSAAESPGARVRTGGHRWTAAPSEANALSR